MHKCRLTEKKQLADLRLRRDVRSKRVQIVQLQVVQHSLVVRVIEAQLLKHLLLWNGRDAVVVRLTEHQHYRPLEHKIKQMNQIK